MNLFSEKRTKPKIIAVFMKIIKAISALRLKTTVDESDIEFLKKHLIHTIIPFHDNRAINKERIINMNKIFQHTFKLLTELHDQISISEHVKFIKEYLTNHYFYIIPEDRAESLELYEYIGIQNNKSNTKYTVLLDNPQNIEFIHSQGYLIDTLNIKNKTTFFLKQEWILSQISKNLTEIFTENKKKVLEYDSILQVLDLNLDFSQELIEKQIKELIKNRVIIREGNKLKMLKQKSKI